MFRLFINLFLVFFLINNVHAQVKDTSTQKISDTLIVTDSVKPKPNHALVIGVDAVKLIYNMADKNKFRFEAIAEYKYKKNTWLSGEFGICRATYNGANLSYTSNTQSIALGIYKSFFNNIKNSKDIDMAFVGLQLGTALATNSLATYTINDVWGTSTGTVPSQTKLLKWTGLTAGFRFSLTKSLLVGWRAKVNVLINPRAFSTIAPIYTALYGNGSALAYFNYNMYLSYRLW